MGRTARGAGRDGRWIRRNPRRGVAQFFFLGRRPFFFPAGFAGDFFPRRAASMVAMSIFRISIIASNARLASAHPAAMALERARGVICQDNPQRSLHQPQ
jgi:hypothetical protein